MKDLKEKEAPLIFRRLTLEINTITSLTFPGVRRTDLFQTCPIPSFLRFLVHKSCLSQQFFVSLKANI